jgi:hypothetical protein
MWNRWHWNAYLLNFPYICRTLNLDSVCDLGVGFTTDCSWNSRWTRTWYGLGLQLELDALTRILRGGQGEGRPRDSLACSPSSWGVLQLGPGSQGWITSSWRWRCSWQKQQQLVLMIWRSYRHDIKVGQDLFETYQASFPSSAHWPQSHSRWMSYDLSNEAMLACRRTDSSTLMDLHFETHLYLQANNETYM